jgi:hypothetical protein
VYSKSRLSVKIEEYPIYISGKRVALFTDVIAAVHVSVMGTV